MLESINRILAALRFWSRESAIDSSPLPTTSSTHLRGSPTETVDRALAALGGLTGLNDRIRIFARARRGLRDHI